MPRPLQFWSDEHRRWLFPLNVIFSIAWALELYVSGYSCFVLYLYWIMILGSLTLKVSSLSNLYNIERPKGARTELAFWLFLLHQGPEKRDWFNSWEYKSWSLGTHPFDFFFLSAQFSLSLSGSMLAVIGMPLTAVVSRGEVERVR